MTDKKSTMALVTNLVTQLNQRPSDYLCDEDWKAVEALEEALAAPVQDEALCFAQWTADKKDLSDYILVGSLSLAGIEDGEYGQSEIDSFENTIEALQEKLVTGVNHKKVPLLAYIGALKSTSLPARRTWVGLTHDEYDAICDKHSAMSDFDFLEDIEAKLMEKNV